VAYEQILTGFLPLPEDEFFWNFPGEIFLRFSAGIFCGVFSGLDFSDFSGRFFGSALSDFSGGFFWGIGRNFCCGFRQFFSAIFLAGVSSGFWNPGDQASEGVREM
jgi:hypothetical protein